MIRALAILTVAIVGATVIALCAGAVTHVRYAVALSRAERRLRDVQRRLDELELNQQRKGPHRGDAK